MPTIQLKIKNPYEANPRLVLPSMSSLINAYLSYADSKGSEKVYWYLMAIVIIPCAVMVPTITLMHFMTNDFVWFIAFCMMLFFVNVLVHIGETKSRVYLPVFHFTILSMILIPCNTYLINYL